MNIDDINIIDLKIILKNLKLYKELTTKIGYRGKKIFNNIINKKNIYIVEYSNNFDYKNLNNEIINLYKKFFNIDLEIKNLIFIKKENLIGGIKIYFNDQMIDLSFKKFNDILKK